MTQEKLNELLKTYNIPEISVDFYKDHYICIPSKQLDTARYILVTLTENGIPRKTKIDEKVSFRAGKPDNTNIYNDAECKIIEDGRILLELTEQTLAAPGKLEADIQLISENNKVYSTRKFYIEVDSLPYNKSSIESSDELNALITLVAEENERVTIVSKLEETVTENEAVRQEQEETRKTNEGNRMTAETGRENDTITAVANANTATSNANTAAVNAASAKEAAHLAAGNANQATQAANTIAEKMRSLIADDNIVHVNKLGVSNGIATLNETGTVPASQLPSFVDDAIEGTAQDIVVDEVTGTKSATGFILANGTVCIPESGKIYVDINDNVTYRWSGSIFVSIGSSLAPGTTANTAFPGDRGLALEERAAALETFHNNLSADRVKYKNTGTALLGANVQDVITELTANATTSKPGRLSPEDKARIDNYANIKEIAITLSAARWTGNTAPYTQAVSTADISIYNNGCIALSPEASPLQESQLISADITDIQYTKESGIVFTASGKKPTADIPIILNIGTSMNCVEIPKYLGTYGSAKEISFNNTGSGLHGQTVQDAIKEVNTVTISKSDKAHTHDDRYYTEAEMNNLLAGKAPANHASTAITYGGGTAGAFGHVKLSDVYNSKVGAAANSIGASQTAIFNMYNEIRALFSEWTKCPVITANWKEIGTGNEYAAYIPNCAVGNTYMIKFSDGAVCKAKAKTNNYLDNVEWITHKTKKCIQSDFDTAAGGLGFVGSGTGGAYTFSTMPNAAIVGISTINPALTVYYYQIS